jgi:cobaltochelatase CobN
MHLLSSRPGGFVEDDSIITRLDQTPADMVVLSSRHHAVAAGRCLPDVAAGRAPGRGSTPTLRLANLLHLRQSASLDLYIDEVLQHARLVIVDHLGAESTWPYGIEQLQKLARRKGQKLAMFSGDNQEDPELLAKGTLEPEQSRALWQYLRAGGLGNAREFLRMAAAWGLNQGREGAPVRVLPPWPCMCLKAGWLTMPGIFRAWTTCRHAGRPAPPWPCWCSTARICWRPIPRPSMPWPTPCSHAA